MQVEGDDAGRHARRQPADLERGYKYSTASCMLVSELRCLISVNDVLSQGRRNEDTVVLWRPGNVNESKASVA
jgi:hypothetical protein